MAHPKTLSVKKMLWRMNESAPKGAWVGSERHSDGYSRRARGGHRWGKDDVVVGLAVRTGRFGKSRTRCQATCLTSCSCHLNKIQAQVERGIRTTGLAAFFNSDTSYQLTLSFDCKDSPDRWCRPDPLIVRRGVDPRCRRIKDVDAPQWRLAGNGLLRIPSIGFTGSKPATFLACRSWWASVRAA